MWTWTPSRQRLHRQQLLVWVKRALLHRVMHGLADMQKGIEDNRVLCRFLLVPGKRFRDSDEKSCSAKMQNSEQNNTSLMPSSSCQRCVTPQKFDVHHFQPEELQRSGGSEMHNPHECQSRNIILIHRPLLPSHRIWLLNGHKLAMWYWGNLRTPKQSNPRSSKKKQSFSAPEGRAGRTNGMFRHTGASAVECHLDD